MEKERRIKALAIVVLVIAVIGLSVAFAALSQTLTINGSAKLDASKWGLKFDNLVLASAPLPNSDYILGEANIKTEDNTVIENMNVRLKTPGDKIVYTVDLVNEGTINAKIDKIEKTQLTAEQSKYLSFKVYKGNTGNDELKEGYVLGKESSIPLRIEIEFDKEKITKEDLPTEASEIKLSYGLTFVQTDEEATSVGQGSSSACTTFEKKDTYNVGDEIALCNNDTGKSEDFYVISDNGDTVTALAKYNLLVGTYKQINSATHEEKYIPLSETEENYGLQSERTKGYYTTLTGIIDFAEDKNNGYGYWIGSNLKFLSKYGTSRPAYVFDENSLLYEPLKNYESYLKTSLGKTSINTSLLSYEQALALGCTTNNHTCEAAPSWVYETCYWLGSAQNMFDVWFACEDGSFNLISFYDSNFYGLRPVINILKSDL